MSDIKGIEVNDLLGLSQPLTKLVEVAARGAGVIYAPFHEKRMAKATAEKIRIIADACQNSLQFPLNYNDAEGLEISTNLSAQELCRRTIARKIFQEMNKQQNIEEVLEHAKNILEQEKEVSKEPVSQTWLSNFFEAAGNVEEEDLQKIWGKLLAGEIKRPNSYSLRTLNTLQNMTSQEAKTFQKIINFAVRIGKNYFLPNQKNLLRNFDLPYEELLLLAENNLLTVDENLHTEGALKAGCSHPIIYNHLIADINTTSPNEIKIRLSIFPFTSIGKELMRLTEIVPNQNFFIEYIKQIEGQFKNTKAHIYKINKINVVNGQEICDCDTELPIY